MNLGYKKNGFLWNSENTKSRFEMEWKEESFFHVRRYESFFIKQFCVWWRDISSKDIFYINGIKGVRAFSMPF
jgi:hypothetical protein